jgi:negative regulator of sigma E activity
MGLVIQELERLDGLMREAIDINVEIRSHEQTLKDLHQQVVAGEEIVSRFPVLCDLV